MAKWKTTVKLDDIFQKKFDKFRKEAAQVLVSMVAEEYVDLLYNTPQYSGNFVANMNIGAGSRIGGKSSGDVMPVLSRSKEDRARAFSRGQLPAISHALGANANVKNNLTNHITSSSGWLTAVTVYNSHPDAELIEKLGPGELRDINRSGAHPMAKFGSKLEAKLSRLIVYESSEWNKYLKANYV